MLMPPSLAVRLMGDQSGCRAFPFWTWDEPQTVLALMDLSLHVAGYLARIRHPLYPPKTEKLLEAAVISDSSD